jgi:hypothetical protein
LVGPELLDLGPRVSRSEVRPAYPEAVTEAVAEFESVAETEAVTEAEPVAGAEN